MPVEHAVRIDGPPTAAPELAAIRVIAQLPRGWKATLTSAADLSVELTLTVPGGTHPSTVANVVDDIVSTPALRGWIRS